MKKTYVQPQVEVVKLESENILTNNSALLPYPNDKWPGQTGL